MDDTCLIHKKWYTKLFWESKDAAWNIFNSQKFFRSSTNLTQVCFMTQRNVELRSASSLFPLPPGPLSSCEIPKNLQVRVYVLYTELDHATLQWEGVTFLWLLTVHRHELLNSCAQCQSGPDVSRAQCSDVNSWTSRRQAQFLVSNCFCQMLILPR